jgi:hypothetical protein
MANVLSLALRVTADATGLKLDPVQRALVGLGDQADKLSGQFDKFSGTSSAAAAAQADFAARSQQLINTLRDGGSATEFATEFAKLGEAASEQAAAFERAAQIIERNRTNFERFTATQRELNEQIDAGRIDQETYNRALEGAAKGLTDAERAAAGLGARTEEINAAADGTALKFNELSGILAILPGPLGNIAGRLSGLTSAGEGLSRVFAGGLRQGITSVGQTIAGLVNPFTIAAAGIVGFGAAAASVAQGLVTLEYRVERLGRLADQLGISFEFVQVLEEAGKRADVSVEQLSGSFARLQNTLAGADEESKKATTALQALGVSVTDFAALSQQQQIALIGQQLASIEDPAQRSAAAIALFGRSGVKLLPFFNELPGAAADIERFGSALSDEDRARFVALGASFDAIGVSLVALTQNALLPFIGVVTSTTTVLADLIGGIANIADALGTALRPVLDQVGTLFQAFGSVASVVGSAVVAVFQSLAPILESIGKFLLPAVVAQMVFLNREILIGAVSSLVRTFIAAGAAIVGYATSAGVATISTAALGAAIRTALASTGVGVLVVGIGLAADALISWATSSDAAADSLGGVGAAAGGLAETAAQAAERQAEAIKSLNTAIADSNKGLDAAINKAGEFGQAGFDAAFKFEQALRELQDQADDKELNAEQYARGVALATAEFEKQISLAKQAADENKKLAQEAERRAAAEIAAVDKLIEANERQQQIASQFGGSDQRFQAAQNLLAIENEIARVEEQQRLAREAGDTAAADAATARLASLDQVAARERDIASGAAEEREAAAKAADELTKKLFAEAQKRADAEVAARKKIEEAQAAFRERQFEVDLARLEELNTVRTGSVEVGDIRSGGISAFFATLQEDPAVSEAKKQTAELTKLNKNIAKLEAQRVDILAGTG